VRRARMARGRQLVGYSSRCIRAVVHVAVQHGMAAQAAFAALTSTKKGPTVNEEPECRGRMCTRSKNVGAECDEKQNEKKILLACTFFSLFSFGERVLKGEWADGSLKEDTLFNVLWTAINDRYSAVVFFLKKGSALQRQALTPATL